MRKRYWTGALVLLTLLVLFVGSTAAQNQRTGTAAATELLIPVGARDLAMGGASIASSQGVDAIYWNPAGLGRMTNLAEGIFSSLSYIADIQVNYGAAAARAGEFGVIGFSIKTLDFGKIPLTTVDDPENLSGATYSPNYVTLGLTYSRQLTDAASVGVSAKLVNETIERVSASAVAFDLGIQYTGLLGLSGFGLGVTVKNIGAQMTYDGTGLLRPAIATEGNRPVQQYKSEAATFELPSMIEIGASYSGKSAEDMVYTLSSSYTNNNLYLDEYRIGGEYGYVVESAKLYARAGYAFVPQVRETKDKIFGVTLGAGITYVTGGVELTFDYAFRQAEFFDSNNMFALRLGFK